MWIVRALKALLLALVTAGSLGQAYPPNAVVDHRWRPRSRPSKAVIPFPAEPQYWEVVEPPARASKRPA